MFAKAGPGHLGRATSGRQGTRSATTAALVGWLLLVWLGPLAGQQPATTAEDRLSAAYAALAQRRWPQAEAILIEALRHEPARDQVWLALGVAVEKQGRRREAIAFYHEALRLRPGWPTAANNLAWLLATGPLPGPDEAQLALRLSQGAVEATGGGNPAFLETLSAAHAACGQADLARRFAEQAALGWRQLGNERAAREAETAVWLRGGERADASDDVADGPPSDEWLADWWKNLPCEPADRALLEHTLWLLAAHPSAQVRDAPLAQRLCQQYHRATDSPVSRGLLAAVLSANHEFQRAGQLRLAGPVELPPLARPGETWRQALAAGQVLRDTMDDGWLLDVAAKATWQRRLAAALALAAFRHSQTGEDSVAHRGWQAAVAIDPRCRAAQAALANEALRRGHIELAAHCAAQATGDGRSPQRVNLLAVLRQRQGRHREAAALYREVLRLRPGWATAQNNLAWLLATEENPPSEQSAEAVRLAKAACAATDHRQPMFLETLAAALAAAGDFSRAADTAGQAAEHWRAAGRHDAADEAQRAAQLYQAGFAPRRDSQPQLQWALLHLQRGQDEEALRQLEACRATNPRDPYVLNSLGVVCQRLGRYREAADWYALALSTRPGWPVAANNLTWVLLHDPQLREKNTHGAWMLARLACANEESAPPMFFETLALAEAHAGRFSDAAVAIRRAQARWRDCGKPAMAEALSDTLAAYESGAMPAAADAADH